LISHYLKTALRSLNRTKLFSLINILGLAVGMAVCLLILQYVTFEKSYDRFHPDSDRIYRLRYERTSEEGTSVRFASCCPPAADFIRGVYPEVETIARIFRYQAVVSRRDRDIKFQEARMYFAEPEFFRIFAFTFIEGNPLTGIRKPATAFVSRSTADKYFGSQDPIGRTLTVDGKVDYTIAGLFEDLPPNSHLKFDIVLSYPNLKDIFPADVFESWGHTGFFTYIRFRPGTDPKAFEKQMIDLVYANCAELMETYRLVIELKLQPLTSIHLTSHYLQEYEINGSRDTVNILGIAALFIILMAWVNYINLSTAHALTRAREVALRKVVGASRRQIISQLFTETAVLNLIALVLALAAVQSLLPTFSRLTGIPVDAAPWGSPWFPAAVGALFAAGILLSGSYPVAAISAFHPVRIIRGALGGVSRGVSLRKILVVFQFIIALTLLTGAFTVYRQVIFMKNQNLGFDIQQVLVVNSPRVRGETFPAQFRAFREEILRNPAILKMCSVTEVPGRQIFWDAGGIFRTGQDSGKGKNYMILGVDYDFMAVFDLEPVFGRNFSRDFPADANALILNETAVEWMGLPGGEEAVGQQIDYWGEIFTVIGILPDYYQQSPKQAFEPTIYRLMPYGRREWGRIALKVGGSGLQDMIRFVEGQYAQFFPGNPFEFFFLDDYFDQQYREEELLGRVMAIFALLAVFITSLGILGMSSFMSLQRTREIGIRKVLGASTPSILRLLSRDFLLMIGAAMIAAWPLTFWGIRRWLNSFAHQMTLNWALFVVPLFLLALLTLLTISAIILRAAAANPADSLKHE
jgi:putative ABC transport system permease protein